MPFALSGVYGSGAVLLFCLYLKAEGPLCLLIGWTLISSLLLHGAVTMEPEKKIRRLVLRSIASAIVLGGITIILVQVNVTRRSLTEAWLALAREGDAFGFFSFFASEIYAVFVLGQCMLLSLKRHWAWFFSALASNALCFGIIQGNGPLLLLAVICVFCLALVMGSGSLRYRLSSLSVPFTCAVLFSTLYTFYVSFLDAPPVPASLGPDLAPALARLAPQFPLLRDVPGYGLTVGSGTMPSSVFLSSRPIFYVQGDPGTVHYLCDERFTTWTGSSWIGTPEMGAEISLRVAESGSAINTLRLRLAEDFTPSLPIEDRTVSVILPDGIPSGTTAHRGLGVHFKPSARRGLRATLVSSSEPSSDPTPDAPVYLETRGNSEDMRSLSRELISQGGTQRRYVELLLAFFSTGYEYSLEAGDPPRGKDKNDWFIFQGKRGFCVYFASAFVMLSREAGIPARLVEGYRVSLDREGEGVITGNNAHAWPELYMDGAWRPFEPTPPFSSGDPFAYTLGSDRTTRRQLEALYGAVVAGTKTSFVGNGWNPFAYAGLGAASVFLALALVVLFRDLLADESKRVARKARRYVRRAQKRGVPPPETTGWLAWMRDAPWLFKGKQAEQALALAERMIEYAYGE